MMIYSAIALSEVLYVVTANGDEMMMTLVQCETGHKYTLAPPCRHDLRRSFKVASTVRLQTANGESFKATVLNNRRGRLIVHIDARIATSDLRKS